MQKKCGHCSTETELDFDFSMAFQPIVDCRNKQIWGYEALVRGLKGEGAGSVISQVDENNRYLFDQLCRIKAITLAAKLGVRSMLSINFLPNAVYEPQRCLRTTLDTAAEQGFPVEQIMFEFTEVEKVQDTDHLSNIVSYYKSQGFITAMDDFGSGYSGLGLLANFQTQLIKLDMDLIRNIDSDPVRQRIIRNCINLFDELGITALAEGIETAAEKTWLEEAGIALMQGYYFAKPGFECLPTVDTDLF